MDKALLILGLLMISVMIALILTIAPLDFDWCVPFNGVEHNGETFKGKVGWCK